jgi:hypothetical protein
VQVDLPKKGIIVRKIGNSQPVYKNLRHYRNSNGTPTTERVIIGKLDTESGRLIPNSRYWEFYGSTGNARFEPEYESVRRIGAPFTLGNVMSRLGLPDLLEQCFGKERAQLIRTVVLYMSAEGNIMEGIGDYCETNTLSEMPLDSQMASQLFASITHDERMSFFKSWIAIQKPEEYLAYDVTSFSTYAKNILDSEVGYNRDGERLPQINMGCFVSETTGLPIFYVTYPGSIVDTSHLPYMMAYNDELGITNNLGFVLDRGFCCTNNVQYLMNGGYKFILGVTKFHKATRMAIDFARPCLSKAQNRIESGTYGLSSSGCYYGADTTMHVYLSNELADSQMDSMFNTLETDEILLLQKRTLTKEEVNKYLDRFIITLANDGTFTFERDFEKINELSKNFGYFCLLTNTQLDTSEALAKYRRKIVIENSFDEIKNYTEMKRLRTHKTETTDGKLFCAFLSLITVSDLWAKLTEPMKRMSLSKEALIREMNKITIGVNDNIPRLLNPFTKRQRTLLKELGLSIEDVKDYLS